MVHAHSACPLGFRVCIHSQPKKVLMEDHRSAVLRGRNGSSEYLFWSVNEHRPRCEGETIVTHAEERRKHGKAPPRKPYPVLHYETLCKGRRQGEEGRRQIMDTVSQGLHWEQTLTPQGEQGVSGRRNTSYQGFL